MSKWVQLETAWDSKGELCRPFAGAACCCRADDWSHLLFKLLSLNSWQLLCCSLRRFTDISKQSLFIIVKRYIISSSLPLLIGSFFSDTSTKIYSIKHLNIYLGGVLHKSTHLQEGKKEKEREKICWEIYEAKQKTTSLTPRPTGICVLFLLAFPSCWTSFRGEEKRFELLC